jgi:hypothetical protein
VPKINVYIFLIKNSGGKRELGNPINRCKNIKMDLQETGRQDVD